MSVIEVREHYMSRSASKSKDTDKSVRLWKVLFDDNTGTPELALVGNDGNRTVPAYGAALPGNPNKLVTNLDAKPSRDSRRLFLVTVTYETINTESGSGGGGAQAPDPLNRPPDIAWGSNTYERVLEKDINGNPIVNSAGDPFDPPLTQRLNVPAVEISYNQAGYNPDTYQPFVDSVNNAIITIAGMDDIDAKGAMLEKHRHRKLFENGTAYHRLTFNVEVAGSYLREVLDRGWHRLPDGAAEEGHYLGNGVFQKPEIMNADGVKPNAPVLLNGAGQPLANGAAPVFRSFETRDALDWEPLSLPTTV
ncbi:MAG: hypothetical protein AAGC44_05170 [Planctomycetota bacterium]